jgi:rod shape-determining protein MreC
LQGVLKGTPAGEVVLDKIMNDEEVRPGEKVLTSGGDQVFPKGLLVGTVSRAVHGPESFLNIQVKAAANLSKLEEVLVITKDEQKAPALADDAAPMRAIDVLAQRLPSVPDRPKVDPATGKAIDSRSASKPTNAEKPAPVPSTAVPSPPIAPAKSQTKPAAVSTEDAPQ